MDMFISYRRQDTSGYALALRREVARRIPDARMFLDVESLDAGVRWRDAISDRVARVDLMLVIIGDEWLVTRAGIKKIDDSDDPVRLELHEFLSRPGVPVIPILVEDARMPSRGELPEGVRGLCDFNAHAIHDRTYDQDMNALLDRLASLAEDMSPTPPTTESGPTPPVGTSNAKFPAKMTARCLAEEVSGMGRDQLLALISELVRRKWSDEDIYEYALSSSPLKPPKALPARITQGWLAANVALLSPKRLNRLIEELRRRSWTEEDVRVHVLGNRQQGLAPPLPQRIPVTWVDRFAGLMTADEQDALATALTERGWSEADVWQYMPYARPVPVSPGTPDAAPDEGWARVRATAEKYGFGDALRQFTESIKGAGLFARPYTRAVMVTPLTHKNRYLALATFTGPEAHISYGPHQIREFYPHLEERTIREVVGKVESSVDQAGLVDFGKGIARLLALPFPTVEDFTVVGSTQGSDDTVHSRPVAVSARTPEMCAPSVVAFDPRSQDPPYTANPKGTQAQKNMAHLTYLGAIMLINLQEGRGATASEVSKMARRAGYANGSAVNGFSAKNASTEVRQDGRWVTAGGRRWIGALSVGLGVILPEQ